MLLIIREISELFTFIVCNVFTEESFILQGKGGAIEFRILFEVLWLILIGH